MPGIQPGNIRQWITPPTELTSEGNKIKPPQKAEEGGREKRMTETNVTEGGKLVKSSNWLSLGISAL